MACKYYYKGLKEFNSELELDNFLLSNQEAFKMYGDIVFDRIPEQNTCLVNLHKTHTEEIQRLKELGKSYRSAHLPDFGFDDIDYSDSTNPYIGVTKMLQDVRIQGDDGKMHRLFPEFNADDFEEDGVMKKGYWSRKFESWSKVTDLEKLPEEEKECLFDTNDDGQYIYTPITKEMMEQARKRFTAKWKFQKIQGLALHEVFNAFFSGDENNKSLRRYPHDKIKHYLTQRLQDKMIMTSENGEPYSEDKFFNLVSPEVFDDMVEIVKNFNQKLTKTCGYDSICLPEFEITSTAINNEGVEVPVVGRIDLLVIDLNGNLQFFDYKVSPKPYLKADPEGIGYDPAKVRSFRYQFATYKRMLERAGTPIDSRTKTYIVPLQMENVHKEEDDSWVYDGVKEYSTVWEDLTSSISSPDIQRNLQKFLPFDRKVAVVDAGDVLTEVDKGMKRSFPTYSSETDNSIEGITEALKNHKRKPLENKNSKGKYETYYFGRKIEADTPVELVKKCKEHADSVLNQLAGTFDIVKSSLMEAQLHNSDSSQYMYQGEVSKMLGNVVTLGLTSNVLSRYATNRWEVLDSKDYPALKQLDALGILVVQNKLTKAVDFIKVSNKHLYNRVLLGSKQNNLLGNYLSDVQIENMPNELALESVQGNIEMMEVMFAINSIPSLFVENSAIVGNIVVLNPYLQQQMPPTSNKLLLYNFSKLMSLGNLGNNNFSLDGKATGKILMASLAENVRLRFNEIIADGEANGYSGKLGRAKGLISAVSEWDSFMGNPQILRAKLQSLAKGLEDAYQLKNPVKTIQTTPEYALYQNILTAIAEIDGYDFKQQISGHDAALEHRRFWAKGWSGLYIDNPGNQTSSILNVTAEAQKVAQLNIRDDMLRFVTKMAPLLKKLLDSRNGIKDARLFEKMTRVVGKPGSYDLIFVDPESPDLNEPEREFLRFVLDVVNTNRNLEPDTEGYYRVPLSLGGNDSKRLTTSWMQEIKEKFRSLNPKIALKKAKEKYEGLLDEDTKDSIRRNEIWEYQVRFDAGEDPYTREQIINDESKGGVGRFERNLETLVLEHVFAYSMKTHMDEIFPTLKAAMMHLVSSNLARNEESANFDTDIKYMLDYITAKIFNQSIIKNLTYRDIETFNKWVMGAASKIALGLNPHQLYQGLDGIWKDTSLIFRNMAGGNIPYTAKHMKDSFFTVYRDIATNSESVSSLLNKLYGINDMDLNTYVKRITSDQMSLDNFLFKFASRPDFYNRMTMFGAHMRADGCWDAHSVVDGQLVYDWTKDERFSLYSLNVDYNTLSSEQKALYDKLKALYIAMARQFIAERTRNLDGSEFKIEDWSKPVPLPKAYTTKQAEALKDETDKIYGYYSHEKKSLWQSTMVGSLLMQMNTYWSSKKNQYLGKSGINIQGQFEHYQEAARDEEGNVKKDENGNTIMEKWYEVVDENGVPTGEYIPESKRTGNTIPFMVWKGLFEEGIALTLYKCWVQLVRGDESGQKGWNHMLLSIWNNEDENLRRMYRNNLVQLWHDLFMWLIMGNIVVPLLNVAVDDYCKKHDDKTIGNAVVNMCLKEAVASTQTSFDDFNFVKSIGGRGMNWTPFAYQTITRQYDNWSRVLGGKKDLYDAMIKTFGATRTTEPIWDYIKISTVGEKIGERKKK